MINSLTARTEQNPKQGFCEKGKKMKSKYDVDMLKRTIELLLERYPELKED